MDLYCVKCKKRTNTNDVTTITTKNNSSALTGTCVQCSIKKFRFVSLDTGFKKNEEVILQPSWQNSLEHHGKSIQEKSTFQDIATVAPEHD